MTRHLDFDRIQNFRDFGGYPTACGGRMASRRFFRSANHHRASDADLERMRELGLAVIVDLRQPTEREREPSRRWEGFSAHLVENAEAEQHTDFHSQVRQGDLSAEWFFNHSLEFYARAPYEPRHLDLFRRYFVALAEKDGPILVHCAAGKDRTGIVCALTHHLAGVHRDDMIEDYLLTNDERRMASRVRFIGDWLESSVGQRPSDEALRVAVSVHPEYLETAFRTIETEQGSLDAYLEETLAIDGPLRERLRSRLLAN